MAKVIKIPFNPDDPIFSDRAIVSVPVSRRLAEKAPTSTAAPSSKVPQEMLDELFREMNESVSHQMGKKPKLRLVKPTRESAARPSGIVTVDLEFMGMTLEEYYAIDDDSTDGKSK